MTESNEKQPVYQKILRRFKSLTWLDVEHFLQYTTERRLLRVLGWMTDPFSSDSVNRFVERDTVPLKKK